MPVHKKYHQTLMHSHEKFQQCARGYIGKCAKLCAVRTNHQVASDEGLTQNVTWWCQQIKFFWELSRFVEVIVFFSITSCSCMLLKFNFFVNVRVFAFSKKSVLDINAKNTQNNKFIKDLGPNLCGVASSVLNICLILTFSFVSRIYCFYSA